MSDFQNRTFSERKTFAPIGASNHAAADRCEHDYYATDPIAIELLLEQMQFSRNIWEPACGDGSLSKVMLSHGYEVYSTDLYDHGYGVIDVDFLENTEPFDGDIITNPPYKYATEFVRKALDTIDDGHYVAMFMKLSFLETKKRRELFGTDPPKYVYVSSSRIACARNGDFSSGRGESSAVAYAWFIWEKGFHGEPIIRWFN